MAGKEGKARRSGLKESSFTWMGMAVLFLGHGCCLEMGVRGAEEIWNPGLKALARDHPLVSDRDAHRNDPCGWS